MTNEEQASFDKHHVMLSEKVHVLTNEVWSLLGGKLFGACEATMDSADLNYIVTGVCVNVFAQHNALMVATGGTPEHGEKVMLENFSDWYKVSFPALLKQFKQGESSGKETSSVLQGPTAGVPATPADVAP